MAGRAVTLLDGPMGTELGARGIPLPASAWSAWALMHRPEVVRAIHRDYSASGATIHTTNTFRTRRRNLGDAWERAARLAVSLAREAAGPGHRVAGSMAPLEDCYRPDLSPAKARAEHRELARVLADAGVDLLLCETFPHAGEARVAVEEAASTGLETWVSLTAGPKGDLLTPTEMAQGAEACVAAGARACLVNCVPAAITLRYLEPLASLGVPCGAYANAGPVDDGIGWAAADRVTGGGAERYAVLARQWVAAGATIVGGCCGTGPEHIRALAGALGRRYGP